MNNTKLKFSILSLSLLTIMAAAAISPALSAIQAHFFTVDALYIKLIISVPALFIILTSFIFPKLCKVLNTKQLTLIGLIFYLIGGCIPGLFDNIYLILLTRALIGIGVGIIMPLSTGLLVYYFPFSEQPKLMGYSSAMNQVGATIANVFAGIFASLNWRYSFLVYLIALIPIVLVFIYLPKDHFTQNEQRSGANFGAFKKYYVLIIAAFLHMSTFFILPSNFSIEGAKSGVITPSMVGIFFGGMDILAMIGGFIFISVNKKLENQTRFVAPILFLIGFVMLAVSNNLVLIAISVLLIGFAQGIGTPYLFNLASYDGKQAAVTIMPWISIAFYSAQFICPFFISLCCMWIINIPHQPFLVASIIAIVYLIWLIPLKAKNN